MQVKAWRNVTVGAFVLSAMIVIMCRVVWWAHITWGISVNQDAFPYSYASSGAIFGGAIFATYYWIKALAGEKQREAQRQERRAGLPVRI
jgi:hypothetical protein